MTFKRNIAVVIGINDYQDGVPILKTPVNDAQALAEILQTHHDYKINLLLDREAKRKDLIELLEKTLPQQVEASDRLILYFAGHGIAQNGEDGPEGYLIPQDARLGDVSTYLPMTRVHDALHQLPCSHFLGVLDCCFAGSFRWSSMRKLVPVDFGIIHKERFDRFIKDPAWQIITSAAHDQEALDAFNLKDYRGQAGKHSPFAAALIEALQGKADAYPPADDKAGKPAGDGVIIATELYMYLRDRVEIATEARVIRQTPGIHPLKKHDKGEYIFLTPGHALNLPPAPPLDESKNPYRGLESFEEEHSELFFGRSELTKELQNFVKTHPLTIVLGASGSGKSSLVKAGLIPTLKQDANEKWCILSPIRPGETPIQALNNALVKAQFAKVELQNSQKTLTQSIAVWAKRNPNSKLLIFIDQSEEIITLCPNETERQEFFQQVLTAIDDHRDKLRVVLSLRSDFEPQIRDVGLKFVPEALNKLGHAELKRRWQHGRFRVSAMKRAELREAIEKPAEARVMYFQPHDLVEQIIDEVADMPGALPLLSFALSELYLKYLRRQRDAEYRGEVIDRALTLEDYHKLGGVIQSLTQRADQEYETLIKQNAAYEQTIRNVMLRMVVVGGELARRRVPESELNYPEPENSRVKDVLQQFLAARLIVVGTDISDKTYFEPAHDELVRGWHRLSIWQKKEEEKLLLQRRLTPAAVEWENLKNKSHDQLKALSKVDSILDWLDRRFFAVESSVNSISGRIVRLWRRTPNQHESLREKPVQFLWNGNPYLDVLNETLRSDTNWFNQVEAEFVQRSVRQRRQNNRTRWVIAWSVILGLSGLSLWALSEQRKAVIDQIRTARQSSETGLSSDNFTLDTLVQSLQAARLQENWLLQMKPPEKQLQEQISATLLRAVYLNREQNRWQVPQGETVEATFINQDSKLLLTSKNDEREICVRDLVTGYNQCETLPEGSNSVNKAQFSPDGKKLAWIEEDFTAFYIWDWSNGQFFSRRQSGSLRNFLFSPDSSSFAFISDRSADESEGASFYKWNWENNQINSFELNGKWINFSFKPDGDLLVTTASTRGDNTTMTLWEQSNSGWESMGKFPVGFPPVDDTIISPSGNSLVMTFGGGRTVGATTQLWKLGRNEPIFLESSPGIAYSSDGNTLAVANDDGTIQLYGSYRYGVQLELRGHQGLISGLSFSQDGKQLLTVGNDNTIRLWNIRTDEDIDVQQLKQEVELPSSAQAISFSSDSKQLVTLESGTISLWNISSGADSPRQFSQRNYSDESRLVFHPNGKQLAIAAPDEGDLFHLSLLDLASGQESPLPGEYRSVDGLSFSPDGKKLAIFEDFGDPSNFQSSLHILNLTSLQKHTTQLAKRTQKAIWRSSNDEDGQLLIAVADIFDNNNSIEIWDVFSNQQLASLRIGRLSMRDLRDISFSNNGDLVSINIMQTTILWDWQSNQSIRLTHDPQDDDEVESSGISSDRSMLAVVTNDKVRLFQLGNLERLIELGCEQAHDYLQNNYDSVERNEELCNP